MSNRTRPIANASKLWQVASVALYFAILPSPAAGQSFQSARENESRVFLEVSPQFNYISQPGVKRTKAYGGEYSAFYEIFPTWSVGASLRQVFSIRTGGTSVLSGIAIHLKHFLWGGSRPQTTQWTFSGQPIARQESRATSGLSITSSLEQIYLNGDESTIPFSGFGVMGQYEFPISDLYSLSFGIGAERLSSAKRVLLPFRAKLGFGIYVP